MWLAVPLAKRRHVELQLPKAYGTSYRNALKAGANVAPVEGMDLIDLDLQQQSDFYFDVGVSLSHLLDDEADLGNLMLTGFANRFHRLLEASLNVTSRIDSSSIKEKPAAARAQTLRRRAQRCCRLRRMEGREDARPHRAERARFQPEDTARQEALTSRRLRIRRS